MLLILNKLRYKSGSSLVTLHMTYYFSAITLLTLLPPVCLAFSVGTIRGQSNC